MDTEDTDEEPDRGILTMMTPRRQETKQGGPRKNAEDEKKYRQKTGGADGLKISGAIPVVASFLALFGFSRGHSTSEFRLGGSAGFAA